MKIFNNDDELSIYKFNILPVSRSILLISPFPSWQPVLSIPFFGFPNLLCISFRKFFRKDLYFWDNVQIRQCWTCSTLAFYFQLLYDTMEDKKSQSSNFKNKNNEIISSITKFSIIPSRWKQLVELFDFVRRTQSREQGSKPFPEKMRSLGSIGVIW